MQTIFKTYLPYTDFNLCGSCFSNEQLYQARKDASDMLTIMSSNKEIPELYAKQPAFALWKGYPTALAIYGLALHNYCFGIRTRKTADIHTNLLEHFNKDKINASLRPPWFKEPMLSKAFRSRLLFEGRIEMLCYSLTKHLKIDSINIWLLNNYFPIKNDLKHSHIEELERIVKQKGFFLDKTHFSSYSWPENDRDWMNIDLAPICGFNF